MHLVMPTNVVAPDGLGGLERYVRELAAARVRAGDRVTVIAKRPESGQGAPPDDGVEVEYYDPPRKSDPLFAVKYSSVVRRGTADALSRIRARSRGERLVVHAHYPVPALAIRGVPYVYTCHGLVHRELLPLRGRSYRLGPGLRAMAAAGMRRAEVRVLGRARTVVTLSDHMREAVRSIAGGELAVEVVGGGVDTERFSPAGAPASFGPRLVAASRLVEGKGVLELVEAMSLVVGRYPDARLTIAGDGAMRPQLEAAITGLGLDHAVRLAGRLDDPALIDLYRASDLAVSPTQTMEPFGLSTAEAMACGTPSIVTPSGGPEEIVAGLGPRFVTKGSTPAAIAAAIVDLAGDEALVRDSRKAARDLVHPALAWDAVALRHSEFYEGASFSA